MKRLIINLLIPTLWLMTLACSSNKQVTRDDAAYLTQPESAAAPDSAAEPGLAARSARQKPDDQYLVVKFRQNDTEVEMALDPNSTNLELDMVRGKDGLMSVTKGDSILYDNTTPDEEELDRRHRDSRPDELLTDEIIRDIHLAQKLFYERRYAEALNVLQASLQRKKTATAYALGGSIYFVNGEIESAVQAWENALQINPQLEDVRQLIMRYKNSQ